MMNSCSLTSYPLVPVALLWLWTATPVAGQSAGTARSDRPAASRTVQAPASGENQDSSNRRSLLRRSRPSDTAPRSASSVTGADSPVPATSQPAQNPPRATSRLRSALTGQRAVPPGRASAPEISSQALGPNPDQPIHNASAPPEATLVAHIPGAALINLSEETLPTVGLTPQQSALQLTPILHELKALSSLDPELIEEKSREITDISAALDSGCESLETASRVHARLIRRALLSVGYLLSESAREVNRDKFQVAVERLDSAIANLSTLGEGQ